MYLKTSIFAFFLTAFSIPSQAEFVPGGDVTIEEGTRNHLYMDLPDSRTWEVELTGLQRDHQIRNAEVTYDYEIAGETARLGIDFDVRDAKKRQNLKGQAGFDTELEWRGDRLFVVLTSPSTTVFHINTPFSSEDGESKTTRKLIGLFLSNPKLSIQMRKKIRTGTRLGVQYHNWTEHYDLNKRGLIRGEHIHVDSWKIATKIKYNIYINKDI